MKHKEDVKNKANKLIKLHEDSGISNEQAMRCALITIEYYNPSPFEQSLWDRTRNYLRSLNYGEDTTIKLNELENELKRQNSFCNHATTYAEFDEAMLAIKTIESKINEIMKELEAKRTESI